jgi:hypothetical protein
MNTLQIDWAKSLNDEYLNEQQYRMNEVRADSLWIGEVQGASVGLSNTTSKNDKRTGHLHPDHDHHHAPPGPVLDRGVWCVDGLGALNVCPQSLMPFLINPTQSILPSPQNTQA